MSNQEQYAIDAMEAPMQINWMGVKIGDVNLDSDPKRSAGRSSNHLIFNVADEKMAAGSQKVIEITAGSFKDITGYQYTLNLDPSVLQVVSIIPGEALNLTDEHFALNRSDDGIITSSWNASDAVSLEEGQVLFSLVVKTLRDAQLSDAMTINSRVTNAEAYNGLDQVSNVALNFTNTGVASDEFVLYQNSPNPFTELTMIGFNLPEADDATLTVYDVNGKILIEREGSFARGYNQFELKKSDLPVAGVLYYQLDTEAFTATKKMVHIR
jgi:hypothetical protein